MQPEFRYLVVVDHRHDDELISRLTENRIHSSYKALLDGRIYRAKMEDIERLQSELEGLSAVDFVSVLLSSFDLTADNLADALRHSAGEPWTAIWPPAEDGHFGKLCFDVGVSQTRRLIKR